MIVRPSPNYGPRRDGLRPDMILIHYTAMASTEKVLNWLCDPVNELSAHYVICHSGAVFQLVEEEQRAWHAGRGSWLGVDDVNSRSIGIELVNTGATPFAAAQMDALEDLLPGIMARHGIGAEAVVGHSDIAPGRKIDPGARFDWLRLARQGLAVLPRPSEAAAPDPEAFCRLLRAAGYTADVPFETLLDAFRLRVRQGHSGPFDSRDMALAAGFA